MGMGAYLDGWTFTSCAVCAFIGISNFPNMELTLYLAFATYRHTGFFVIVSLPFRSSESAEFCVKYDRFFPMKNPREVV